MPTSTISNIKGAEIPLKWAQAVQADPNQIYVITIQTQENQKAKREALQKSMDRLHEEAVKSGVTQEKIAEMLGCDPNDLF